MLKVESILKGKDTSGVKLGKCIHVYRGGYNPSATIGDFILIAVQAKDPHKKISKSKHLAVITTVKKMFRRLSGHYISFQHNSMVIMQDKETFKSKKVHGPVSSDLKYNKNTKSIVSVSRKWL